MKRIIGLLLIALIFFNYSLAQDPERPIKFDVAKIVQVTEAQRDLYVVPVGETWLCDNTTAGQVQINRGGSGWVTIGGSGGGIADGDKGDVTVSGSGATFTINDGVVTGAKIENETITAFDIQNNSISSTDLSSSSSKEAGEYVSYSGSGLDFKQIEASEIGVADVGGNYTATDVEGILTEIAPQLGGVDQAVDYTWTGNHQFNEPITLKQRSDTNNTTSLVIQGASDTFSDGGLSWSNPKGIYLSNLVALTELSLSPDGDLDYNGNVDITGEYRVNGVAIGGSGLTATQTDQLEGLYGSWYEVMTGDEDGTQDPFLDLNGERRQRVGYVQASQALTVTLDNTHELGRKYMYFVSSATSSITFQASSGVGIIFEGQGDSQTGDQILVDALGSHVYFTRIANNLYVLAAEGTISSQDFTPPTITSATVENSNPNEVVVVFSEPVNRLSQPTYPRLSGGITENYVSHTGQGTNTLTFTYTTAFQTGDVVNFDYISSTFEDLSGNLLVAGSTSITNNVGPSNLYAEQSNANATNTGGLGSWVSDQGGTPTAVTEDSFAAIQIFPTEGGTNDAAAIPLEGAGVSTWSGGQITSLVPGATYQVTVDVKNDDAALFQIWTGSALSNADGISSSGTFTERVFTFIVPGGGYTSGAVLGFRADNNDGNGTLWIKNLRIVQQ